MNQKPKSGSIYEMPDELWANHLEGATIALDILIGRKLSFKENAIKLLEIIAKSEDRNEPIQITCFVLAAAIERLVRIKEESSHEKEKA